MRIVDASSAPEEWDRFVEAMPDATSHHRFGWGSVVSLSFNHRCYYRAAVDDSRGWRGVLQLVHLRSRLFGNFLASMAFLNYGGILAMDDQAVALLLADAENLRRQLGALRTGLAEA